MGIRTHMGETRRCWGPQWVVGLAIRVPFVTPDGCGYMNAKLHNASLQHHRHVDMWLIGLLRQQQGRGFQFLKPLAGTGHRVSTSKGEEGVQKFGGVWLPPGDNGI